MCDKEEDDMIAPAAKPIDNIEVSENREIKKIIEIINNPKEPSDFIKSIFKNYKRNRTED